MKADTAKYGEMNLLELLTRQISLATNRVILVSAYVKYDALSLLLDDHVPDFLQRRELFLRGRKQDFTSGASDLGALELAMSLGFGVFVESKLHAKAYTADNVTYIGSANLTASGFALRGSCSNLEFMHKLDSNLDYEQWLARLRNRSQKLSPETVQSMREELELSAKTWGAADEWSDATRALLGVLGGTEELSFYDLFWSESPQDLGVGKDHDRFLQAQHDLLLLGLADVPSGSLLKERFLESLGWRWLSRSASSPQSFGALSSRLHDDLKDDPNPFRRDVKIALQNLVNWGSELAPESCIVTRPGHSQVIQVI